MLLDGMETEARLRACPKITAGHLSVRLKFLPALGESG